MLNNKSVRQTIAVTGAASGIGAACCRALKAADAKVIGLDIVQPEHSALDDFIEFDQGDCANIQSAVKALPEKLTGLMNVAGVAPSARYSPADVLRINFFGVRELTEGVIGKLRGEAAIVNMTSGTAAGWTQNVDTIKAFLMLENAAEIPGFVVEHEIGIDGLGNQSAYPFSKQLLSVWTMQMAGRLRDHGIRVNAVAPAAVNTPIVGDFLASFGQEAATRMRGFGAATPEQIAAVCLFLSSHEAAWVNGAVLPVDSGAIAAGTLAKLGLG